MANTPFKDGNKITQEFGKDFVEKYVNGQPVYYYKSRGLPGGHEGLDLIPKSADKKIYIIEDGEVIRDNTFDRSYGIYSVVWNQENRRAWWYCHLQSEKLSLGQKVKRGDEAGVMGATGSAIGEHLHLGLRYGDANKNPINTNNGTQGFVNPLPVLDQLNQVSTGGVLRTVALSAGHFTNDPGATSGGLVERDLTIEITNKAVDILRKHGVGVLDVPDDIDLKPTIDWINARADTNKIELCIEIHINAGGGNGTEAWAYSNNGVVDPKSAKLGEFIIDAISVEAKLKKRGVKGEHLNQHGRLGFVHDTIPLAALIECAFIDGEEDRKVLSTSEGRSNIAKGIARGILGYMGIAWKPEVFLPPVVTPPPSEEVFLGKLKSYWLQLEVDKVNLLKAVEETKNTSYQKAVTDAIAKVTELKK